MKNKILAFFFIIATVSLIAFFKGYFTNSKVSVGVDNNDSKNISDDNIEKEFDGFFSLLKRIEIEQDTNRPIFNISSMAMNNNTIAIVDKPSSTLTVLTSEGKIKYQVDRKGRGPGSLLNPWGVEIDNKGRVVVLESPINNRVQIFDQNNGEVIKVINKNIKHVGPDAFFVSPNSILFSTRALCSSDVDSTAVVGDDNLCVIQRVSLENANKFKRMVPINKVEPGAFNLPWTLGIGENGRYYISHYMGGSNMSIVDPNGDVINNFKINKAPNIKSIKYEKLPNRIKSKKRINMLKDIFSSDNFSKITSIVPYKHLIIVGVTESNAHKGSNKSFAVFDKNGSFLTHTEMTPLDLHQRSGNRFYFVSTDGNGNRQHTVQIYRYIGPGI